MMKRQMMIKISKVLEEFTIRYDRQFTEAACFAMELHRTPERAEKETLIVHFRRYDGPDGEITHRVIDAHVQPMDVNDLTEAYGRYKRTAPRGSTTLLTTFYDHTSMCTWIVPTNLVPGYFQDWRWRQKLKAKNPAEWKQRLIDEVGGTESAWDID
jgi:hypothetical protein